MRVNRDIPPIGRESMLLLTAETFEEERILKMLESVIKRGGTIHMEDDEMGMTAKFDQKEMAENE